VFWHARLQVGEYSTCSPLEKFTGRQWNGYSIIIEVLKMLAWYMKKDSITRNSVTGFVNLYYTGDLGWRRLLSDYIFHSL
jgi:hypothetical protein